MALSLLSHWKYPFNITDSSLNHLNSKMRTYDLDTNHLFLSCWITIIRDCHFFLWGVGGWRQDFDSSECSNSRLGHEASPMLSIEVTAVCFSLLLAMSWASPWRQLYVAGADGQKRWTVRSLDLLDQRSLLKRV